ncbi:MAG: DUF2804 domain-containing protein [Clostridiales bacterium]|nr:DUF2804 domain-containing protein [Clostridiales bacterium]
MRNHEITKPTPLLDEYGRLTQPGWARKPFFTYDRKAIKTSKLRIKEWDYYIVMSDNFGLALTVSDIGYIALMSVSLLDFTQPWEITNTVIKPLPLGKLKMPPSPEEGNVYFRDKNLTIEYTVSPGKRWLKCEHKKFSEGKTLTCDVELTQPEIDSLVIATPWAEDEKAFYYNQKFNCMPAKGFVNFDGKDYVFNPQKDFGTLDWGRGVWTYDNTWYWGSGNGLVEGKPFGFNIGYGFGNTAAASENILFYEGRGHKLDDVSFNIPPDSYTKPWTFSSSDGRFEMDFLPVIDRYARTSALVISTEQHQVFGKMSGKAVLDDGRVLEVKDLLCFAEDVHNRY